MDVQTTKIVYTITITQDEMNDIVMAAHHYIMREYPDVGEIFTKAQKDEVDIIFEISDEDAY